MLTKSFSYDKSKAVNLKAYLLEPINDIEFTQKRPAVLIFPGGGYEKVSVREGEPIAMKFLAMGYNAFVLTYEVCSPFPSPLINAAWAIGVIRRYDEMFHIDKNKVAVCGFSAGAHLAAMISNMYDCKEISDELDFDDISFRPDAQILCYPVIDGTKYAHKSSFDFLLGKDASEDERKALSMQNKVSKNTPPAFLWHTANDDTVPVQNSLIYAKALSDFNIPYELRIYDEGVHGISTCQKQTAHYEAHINPHCEDWIDLAVYFLKKHL